MNNLVIKQNEQNLVITLFWISPESRQPRNSVCQLCNSRHVVLSLAKPPICIYNEPSCARKGGSFEAHYHQFYQLLVWNFLQRSLLEFILYLVNTRIFIYCIIQCHANAGWGTITDLLVLVDVMIVYKVFKTKCYSSQSIGDQFA